MDQVFVSRLHASHAGAISLLAFCTGWFVMLTELVAARVLAPYFGNTIYVWGSVIAIFLATLAIGYALGGRLTRISTSPFIPTGFAAAAGVYVALTPLYQDALSSKLYFTGLEVKWGALFAAIILYGLPMVLLGAVSPYCIQLATRTQREAGHSAGVLYAISTIGSFGGSLVTAFYLIPLLPLTEIIVVGGLAAALISLLSALTITGRRKAAQILALVILVAALGLGYYHVIHAWQPGPKAYQYPLEGRTLSEVAPSGLPSVLAQAQEEARREAKRFMSVGPTTIFKRETPYHLVVVHQEGPIRKLIFGQQGFKGAQTVIDLRDLAYHCSEYTMLSLAAMLFEPRPKRVCVIGLGGAVIPRAIELCLPGVQIDAVEIDPTVIGIAGEYFFWRPSKNVRVYAQDGRSFLNWCLTNRRPKYDWIILDAYSEDYVPFHLTTVEFFAVAKRMLAPNGVLASNLAIDNDLYGCEARTFHMIFGNATSFVGHRSGNVILIAQNGRSSPLSINEAARAARQIRLPANSRIDLRYILSCLTEQPLFETTGPVLSDHWSPVEILIR